MSGERGTYGGPHRSALGGHTVLHEHMLKDVCRTVSHTCQSWWGEKGDVSGRVLSRSCGAGAGAGGKLWAPVRVATGD